MKESREGTKSLSDGNPVSLSKGPEKIYVSPSFFVGVSHGS